MVNKKGISLSIGTGTVDNGDCAAMADRFSCGCLFYLKEVLQS
jgi:hypothetical protein